MSQPFDPTTLLGRALDAARKVLGANQPELVADIATQRALEGLERVLPTLNTHALAHLVDALANKQKAQALYDYVHRDDLARVPFVDASPPPALRDPSTKEPREDNTDQYTDEVFDKLAHLRNQVHSLEDDAIKQLLQRLLTD